MPPIPHALTRRDCLHVVTGTVAAGLGGALPALAESRAAKRQVLVLSDIHIGYKDDDIDGGEWFSRALKELKNNKVSIDYAMVLGDIAHSAKQEVYETYLELRDKSGIDTWFELAGNHEYRDGTCEHYEALVRSTKPYSHIDGNTAWFFISDEEQGVPGNLSDKSYAWLKKRVAEHQDKIVIVCSHQLVDDTIRRSTSSQRHIHPTEKIAALLAEYRVDLWMCGHEHHRPYSQEEHARKDGTTFLNVASMSHAYDSKASQSFLLEFVDGAKKIVARRRVHDTQQFDTDYEILVPLDREIRLGKQR